MSRDSHQFELKSSNVSGHILHSTFAAVVVVGIGTVEVVVKEVVDNLAPVVDTLVLVVDTVALVVDTAVLVVAVDIVVAVVGTWRKTRRRRE